MAISIDLNQSQDDILTELFCHIDDFLQSFHYESSVPLLEKGFLYHREFCRMSASEVMTILIAFHLLGAHDFKQFYTRQILEFHRDAFPDPLSYSRFVEVAETMSVPLEVEAFLSFLLSQGRKTGLYFVDSMPIAVCHNLRIKQNRLMKGIAQRGKSSTGWFYGFKLHLITNHLGEIVAARVTTGNVNDRIPVPEMAAGLTGKLFGDKGYISQKLTESMCKQGLLLITKVRKNMKNRLMSLFDRTMLRKRAVIETINDLLQNHFQIEHPRHRSHRGFVNNTLSALISYCLLPKKPGVRGLETTNEQMLPVAA